MTAGPGRYVGVDVTERAMVLADAASDVIWGGERGWESCTDEQLKTLKSKIYQLGKLRNKLKDQIGRHANTAHFVDIIVRDGGKNYQYEFDWVKQILRDGA